MTEYRPIKFWQPKMRCSFWVFLILLLLYIKVIMNEKIRVLGACLWRCRFNVPIKLNQISVYFAGMAKLSFELEVCRIPNLNVSVSCAALNCVFTRQFFREITTFISRLSSFHDFFLFILQVWRSSPSNWRFAEFLIWTWWESDASD